jgi:hypothetical protein
MKKTIVIFAALALVFVFAGTTMAADWSLYGSARFATFWENNDKDSPTNTSNSSPAQDDSDLLWNNQGNIRFGGTATAGDIGGGYEAGFDGGEFYLRKLYGTWNFGSGELLVGQTYTPVVQFLSNQVGGGDADLLGTGAFYPGRQPMLQLSMAGFKVALIKPNVGEPDTTATVLSLVGPAVTAVPNTKAGLFGATAAVDTDVTLPKIELSYKFSSDMFWIEPFAGYQTYDLVAADDSSKSVDAYVLGIGGAVTVGPAQIKASGYLAQNSGAYGATGGYIMTNPHANKGNPAFVGTEFKDNDEWGGLLVVAFNINDQLSAEVGGGMRNNEVEQTAGIKTKTQVYSIYANLPIKLADGFVITPEVGMVDGGDLDVGGIKTSQGTDSYFGAKWQIDF